MTTKTERWETVDIGALYPGTVTSNEARTYAEWRAWTAASAGPSAWQDFLADRYPQEWQGEPWCRNV